MRPALPPGTQGQVPPGGSIGGAPIGIQGPGTPGWNRHNRRLRNRMVNGGGANVLDSPLLAAAHLFSVLKDQPQFEPVQAGEIVTTGTLTAALPIHPGETWSTALSGLALPGLTIYFR